MEYISPTVQIVTPMDSMNSPSCDCYNAIEAPVPAPCECNMGQARL